MARRVDSNQRQIVGELTVCGFHVTILSAVGHGVPDLVVTGHRRQTGQTEALFVEVKTAKGKLTPTEAQWHNEFPTDGPLIVARCSEDVLRWFGYA
jgi:hypothetical protein